MMGEGLASIVEMLLHEDTGSVHLRTSIAQSKWLVTRPDGQPTTIEEVYIQSTNGRRSFDERILVADGHRSRPTYYCDGEKCASVIYKKNEPEIQERIEIGHNFAEESRLGFFAAPRP